MRPYSPASYVGVYVVFSSKWLSTKLCDLRFNIDLPPRKSLEGDDAPFCVTLTLCLSSDYLDEWTNIDWAAFDQMAVSFPGIKEVRLAFERVSGEVKRKSLVDVITDSLEDRLVNLHRAEKLSVAWWDSATGNIFTKL